MISSHAQFRILYRDFSRRLIDLDALSTSGDPQKLFVHFAAILAALSLMIVMLMIGPYTSGRHTHGRLMAAATGDEQFLIGTTMAVVGIFGVLAWGAMLPDRRDALVLGALPVDWRIVLGAKLFNLY